MMTVKIIPNDKGNPPGKLADAELHFDDEAPDCNLCGNPMQYDAREASEADDDAECGIHPQWVCFCNGGNYRT